MEPLLKEAIRLRKERE
ncbi:Protein of unknown function [Bacillus cytotoxicus]|uniref:Uncharacterized protein n=1 Tax=Bacillus cytotoxicus TaxID=580165 RepID=A0AAX2CIK8_9BACI|nr:Protein of unknown function [Bacillus cytotoxicus]SCN37217.1 Protein of unknown function [Bacillus cytotoxicus]